MFLQFVFVVWFKCFVGVGIDGWVFFFNLGVEVNEVVFKFVCFYGGVEWLCIIVFENGFYGCMMGLFVFIVKELMCVLFVLMLGGVEYIFVIVEVFEIVIDDCVVVVIVEFIQGEVGVVELLDGYFVVVWLLIFVYGVLLIVDEIQIGVGCIGQWFGFSYEGIMFDVIIFVKGIGGGFLIGVFVMYGVVSELFILGLYGFMFGGNLLVIVVVDVVFVEIESVGFVENVVCCGVELCEIFDGIDFLLIDGVCGCGLFVGVVFSQLVVSVVVVVVQECGFIVNVVNLEIVCIVLVFIIGDVEFVEFCELFIVVFVDVQVFVVGKVFV